MCILKVSGVLCGISCVIFTESWLLAEIFGRKTRVFNFV